MCRSCKLRQPFSRTFAALAFNIIVEGVESPDLTEGLNLSGMSRQHLNPPSQVSHGEMWIYSRQYFLLQVTDNWI